MEFIQVNIESILNLVKAVEGLDKSLSGNEEVLKFDYVKATATKYWDVFQAKTQKVIQNVDSYGKCNPFIKLFCIHIINRLIDK